MPSFDIVSELDFQEIRNAIDQASREFTQRYDFKGTDTKVELTEEAISLNSESEERLNAARQVVEEKLVKRKVSLRGVNFGEIDTAAGGRVAQVATLNSGISSENAKELHKFIKELKLKGIQSQTQGDQLRVTGKKRDDLQEIISLMKETDFKVALQFINFRD